MGHGGPGDSCSGENGGRGDDDNELVTMEAFLEALKSKVM